MLGGVTSRMDIANSEQDCSKGFENIFLSARSADEFEFILVLLGYEGAMGDPRALSHLYESERLFKELSKSVTSNPNDFVSIRIGLFLYCHFFEMNELYRILGNFFNIIRGNQYQVGLFSEWANDDKPLYPSDKIPVLKKLAAQCGMQDFMEAFEALYFNRLRNSFFHSDYSIVDTEYLLVSNKPIVIDGVRHLSLDIETFLLPLIQSVIRLALFFFELLRKLKAQYTSHKLVQGRFPHWQPIVILGHPDKGLIGFENIYGGSIRLTEMEGQPFLAAFNIQISRSKKQSDLEKRLSEFVDKNHYQKNDPELISLEADIKASGDASLLKSLAIAFYNWGNNINLLAEGNPNPKAKEALYQIAITKYYVALAYDSEMAVCIFNMTLTFLRLKKLGIIISDDKAISENFERVIELKPDMPEIYEPAADHFHDSGKNADDPQTAIKNFMRAAALFEVACKINPEKANLHHNRGSTYIALLKLDPGNASEYIAKSRESLQLAIDNAPSRLDHYIEYATLLENAADVVFDSRVKLLKEAVSFLDKGIELNNLVPRPYFKKGNDLVFLAFELSDEKEKLLLESIEVYGKCIELNNLNDAYFNNIGRALFYLGEHYKDERSDAVIKEAIENLNKALSLKKDKKESYYNLGDCYFLKYKLFQKPEDEKLALESFQAAQNLGENINYAMLAYNSIKEDKQKSLEYLAKYKNDSGFNPEHLENNEDMAFVRSLKEAGQILKG